MELQDEYVEEARQSGITGVLQSCLSAESRVNNEHPVPNKAAPWDSLGTKCL
jgi:hypothetical protein